MLNFNLTSDTGEKKGFLGGAQLNSLPKTPDGKKIITSIDAHIPDVAKNGDIITIKTNMKGGGKTSNYKVNTATNELIPVDSTGTPTGAPPIPIVNGKAEITGVENFKPWQNNRNKLIHHWWQDIYRATNCL
ncbi:hypothetical protein VBZ67_03755 [Campylobacter concisus]